jgi:hypothetical protein
VPAFCFTDGVLQIKLDSAGSQKLIGPWPNLNSVRLFLASLVTSQWDSPSRGSLQSVDVEALARWLIKHDLASLAYSRCRGAVPELVLLLAERFFPSAARNVLHFHELNQVLEGLHAAGIPVVLLKGAALASEAYGEWTRRPMGDVDLWLRSVDMQEAAAIMQRLGFRMKIRRDRPLALQSLVGGELQFYKLGLVELHQSPFAGCWLHRTAAVDDDEIWERTEPVTLAFKDLPGARSSAGGGWSELVRQLAPEDMVIQVAVHLAVNHQFGMAALRGLLDIALTAHTRPVNWYVVAERARRWRVGTAVWTVLDLAERLIGLPGVEEVLINLSPTSFRRVLLKLLVSPQSMLDGRDLRESPLRYLILLLLVDRPWDAAYLVFRTLWPEEEWLVARYEEQASRWHHLWNVARHGQV